MPIAPGTRIDRYEIISLLGEGGMGEVYLALDTRLNRKLALKLLHAALTRDDDRMRRFEREARAASALNHPNILTVFEIGQAGDVPFIATELIDGETLRARMTRARMTLCDALDVAIQLASALSAAHVAKVIHRDIKPENVMLRTDGYVKVLDFGLAKLIEASAAVVGPSAATVADFHTQAHVVMGTTRYMSPEQARGLTVDNRTDIFSLGIVLYEMVAGVTPFDGATASDVIAAILTTDPAPLARYVSEVPAELERILARALCNDRDARYQDVKDVLIDLKSLKQRLDADPVTAAGSGPVDTPRSTSIAEYLVSQIKHHALGAVLALAAVVVSVGATIYVTQSSGAIESVAILPFTNVGGNPDTEWLSDGITESLIRQLSELPHVTVRPRHAVFRYKNREMDPQAVGRELKVQAVLIGRTVLHGDALTIRVELLDVRANRQLWGEQYDETLTNLLRAQTDISRDVTDKLRVRLSGAEQQQLAKRYTPDADAYQLYLKGRFYESQFTADGSRNAIAYFQQAIKKDPKYALAYVGLADVYIQLGADRLPPKEAMPQAAAYALEALRLDETLAEAHAALGIVKLVYEWDWPAAERELGPNLTRGLQAVEAFSCALHYADPLGRHQEALVEIGRALAQDPLSLLARLELGCASYYARQYDQAITQFLSLLATNPDYVPAYFGIGRSYGQKGMYREAIAALSKGVALSQNAPAIVAELGHAYAASGQSAEARKLLEELKAQATSRYVDPYLVAMVYVAMGDTDEAFARLEHAYQDRSGYLPWLKVEPKWDSVRRDSRFADLLRRIHLEP
ncbi:MAG: protein kinase domain-containing protein [Acidobacteriota bacterium]